MNAAPCASGAAQAATPPPGGCPQAPRDFKAASHAEARAAHLALPLGERRQRSWALYEAHRAAFAGRHDDPTPFYDRARELGLYTP